MGLKRKEIKECHQSGLKATEGGAASLASRPLRYILGLWARFGDSGSAIDRNWDTERARSLTHLAEGLLVGVGGNLFGDGDADVSAVGLAREDVDAGLPCGGKERE